MKWLTGVLLSAALLISGYALYRVHKLESAAKPRVRLIAAQVR